MARGKSPTSDDDDVTERIVDVDVSSEMQTSFLEYAYSVIYTRALPDARDGLKPVQRRILYTMQEMRVLPDRSHVKCARVVGQVMGLLHPHGDGAIYDALVRMHQPWSMRLPMVDGHGNFGSLDDGPAAMRYTECRMAPAALAMTADLDQDAVEFKPNYDGKEIEPTVLPAAIPNLLVNGASGIAVGMATNVPPHNLVEVVQALRHLLRHPGADLTTLTRFIPGPDLPSGGKIIGLDGIADAYATGRGSFKVRATTRIEQVGRRKGVVITELPYLVGPERVTEQIKTLVASKRLEGIADIKDLTDRTNGLRLVVEIKNGFNPDAVAEKLFRLTKMEDTFSINAVALVDGQPRTLGLKEMLEVYLAHRLDVVLRRSRHQRTKALDRLHLVEGLLIAIVDIDDVIAIIRSSDDVAEARERLMAAFDLTETQTGYILDMPLRRLTRFSTIELERERDELHTTITGLTEIIDDDAVLRNVVGVELAEIASQHGTPRRTVLLAASGVAATATAAPLEVADDPCWVLMSSAGLLVRTDTDAELPASGAARANHDVVVSAIRLTARGEFGVVTSAGRVLRARALDLPTVRVTASAPNLQGGLPLSELLMLERNETALCLTTLAEKSLGLALGTARGVVKRVNPEVLTRDAWEVIRLEPGDRVVGAVELTDLSSELVFVTSDAQLLHFPAGSVRPQGRAGGGMAGIKLTVGASVVFFGATGPDAEVVTIAGSTASLPGTDTGTAKVTVFAEYPGKGRATGGVRCHRFLRGEDTLLLAWVGPGPARAAAASGAPVDLPAPDGRRDGSGVPVAQPIIAVGPARLG